MHINLDNLSSEKIELLIKDLLNQTKIVTDIEHNTPPYLKTEKSKYQPDLIAFDANRVDEIVEVKSFTTLPKNLIEQLLNDIGDFYKTYFPRRFILVVTIPVQQTLIYEIRQEFEHNIPLEVEVLDLGWIEEALNTYPEIAKKYGLINTKSYDPSGLLSRSKLFLAEYKVGNEDMSEKFLADNSWTSYGPKNKSPHITDVKPGDILILKSYTQARNHFIMTIKAFGVVLNDDYTQAVQVRWEHFYTEIKVPDIKVFALGFSKLPEEYKEEFFGKITQSSVQAHGLLKKIENTVRNVTDRANVGASYIQNIIQRNINEKQQFWWYNHDSPTFNSESITLDIRANPKVFPIELNQLALGFTSQKQLTAILQVSRKNTSNEGGNVVLTGFVLRVVYFLKNPLNIEDLQDAEVLKLYDLLSYTDSQINKITLGHFVDVINATELATISENNNSISKLVSQELTRTIVDNDSIYSTKDLLNIENDVRSFALLLASKEVNPPIAIALFGNWGSGKSFFMRHLQSKISELSRYQGFLASQEETDIEISSNEDVFCKGIAQIEFNAWSYLDSNLWAGLASSIFEKLNEYITNSTKSGVAKLQVREKLKERLKTWQSEKKTIKARKDELIDLKVQYQEEKFNLEHLLKRSFEVNILKTIDSERIRSLYDNVSKDGHLATMIQELRFTQAIHDARIFKTFFRSIRKVKVLRRYLLAAAISIGVIVLMTLLIDQWRYSLTCLAPLISLLGIDMTKIRRRYTKVKAFANDFNQEVQHNLELAEKVEEHKIQVDLIEDQVKEAEHEIDELDIKIEQFEDYIESEIHHETIKDFISNRNDHDDYKSRLGVVSIIRKDFETLSELFYEQSKKSHSTPSGGNNLNKHFRDGQRLERIILYIDDLDRCPDDKVLEVIQAVHLLLAFPLFNVVVGVDKRCVRNALYLKTNLEYRKITDFTEIQKIGVEMVTPDEYLEKIFQIPFELKSPSRKSLNRLVDYMLDQSENLLDDASPFSEEDNQDDLQADEEKRDIQADFPQEPRFQSSDNDITAEKFEPQKDSKDDGDLYSDPNHPPGTYLVSSAPGTLVLSQLEKDRLKQMLTLVGNTPRSVKQFINIYRIIRSHEVIKYDDSKKEDVFLFIIFLLTMTLGLHRDHARNFEIILKLNGAKKISTLLKRLGNEGQEIQKKIGELDRCKEVLNFKPADFDQDIIDFVGRFSFSKELATVKTHPPLPNAPD